MPYTYRKVGNKKCVYKKDTGKKLGCTAGPIKKYLGALHSVDEMKSFKEFYNEGEYAQSQDYVQSPSGYDTIGRTPKTFTVEKKNKENVISQSIDFLEKLNKTGIPSSPEKLELLVGKLQKVANDLTGVGVEPNDFINAIKEPSKIKQYLITGPTDTGNGALQDLKDIKAGLLLDDESNPGGADTTADIENIDNNITSIEDEPAGPL